MNRLALFATLATLAVGPAQATDLDSLTDAERAAFRDEVRSYLIENPEVLMEAFAVLEEREAAAEIERETMAIAANADMLYNSAFDWVGGNPDGDITIVEFFDYRCGFCRRVHPELAAFLELDGNIRYIAKEYPILGDQSVVASRFAIATRIAHGDEAYDAMNDALMEMRGDMTVPALAQIASGLGYDAAAILGALGDPQVQSTLDVNQTLGERLGVSGTPTFIFGNQIVRGAMGVDDMAMIVAGQRAQLQ